MFKRNKLSIEKAQKGLLTFSNFPFRYIEPDFVKVLNLSKQTKMYAVDMIREGRER